MMMAQPRILVQAEPRPPTIVIDACDVDKVEACQASLHRRFNDDLPARPST